MKKVSILGAGAWGTALAITAARAGNQVCLWAHKSDRVERLQQTRINEDYLPNISLPSSIEITGSLQRAAAADTLLLVMPAQSLREVCRQLNPFLTEAVPLLICAKGIEISSGALMSDVLNAECPKAVVGVLSGPTFAIEVALGQPSALTLAIQDQKLGEQLVATLGTPYFRPYLSSDLIGVQIGGAVKNVLAIACGIVTGAGLGDNARAALITRGLAELTRFAVAKGAQAETLRGLSGLGDLVLTAASTQSRNYSLGFALGQGQKLGAILENRHSVTEGVHTAKVITKTAQALKVEMPICNAIHNILYQNMPVAQAITDLLHRPFKSE